MRIITKIALCCFLTVCAGLSAFGQGTAFTYEGQLQTTNGPTTGIYNFNFTLYDTNTGGTAVAGPVTTNSVGVTNGLFTVFVDFGADAFTGTSNWLQIAVETNGASSFTNLPRQQVTPVPYAIYAESGGNATALASGAAIGAGSDNTISPTGTTDSFIGGGEQNQILAYSINSAIAGGQNNIIGTNNIAAFMGGGQNNYIGGSGWGNTISGGVTNQILTGSIPPFTATFDTIAGGWGNTIGTNDTTSVISGGIGNYIGSFMGLPGLFVMSSTIGGGQFNTNLASGATVSGGVNNTASGQNATVPGGYHNVASGANSFAAGVYAMAGPYAILQYAPLYNNTFVWSDGTGPTASTANNQFLARASGGVVFETSVASSNNLTLTINFGGQEGDSLAFQVAVNNGPMIAAGTTTTFDEIPDEVATNLYESISNAFANPPGSQLGLSAVVNGNVITVTSLTAWENLTPSVSVTTNTAEGAAWLLALSSGFVPVTGSQLAAGSGSWSMMSDRKAKANFNAINPQDVLEEVATMPVTTWNYKAQDKSIRHIGPMAQDFHTAFGVGENDTTISTVDEGGVALAAIQGLNQKLEEKNSEIQKLKVQNDSLAERLSELEAIVKQQAAQQ